MLFPCRLMCVLNVTGMTLFLIDIAVEYVALSVIVEDKRK